MAAKGTRSLIRFLTLVLNVGWAAAAGLLVLSCCLLVVSPWVDPPRIEVQLALPVSFTIETHAHHLAAPALGVDAADLWSTQGSLVFSPHSSTAVAAWTIVLIATIALVLWVIVQLRAIFSTLRAGRPFVPINATRIRRIGWAFMLGEVLRLTFTLVASRYAMTHFTADGLRLGYRTDFDAFAILSGLIILVIAEVFSEATRLAEEQSLTV